MYVLVPGLSGLPWSLFIPFVGEYFVYVGSDGTHTILPVNSQENIGKDLFYY